jgi:putative (di)nucleoside polyphosphate hydrolase
MTLPYEEGFRLGIGICLLSPHQKQDVFAGLRSDCTDDVWQMPQGGIDPGETALEALFREMNEEIGTHKARVLQETPWMDYELPEYVKKRPWDGRFYHHQRQKWFLCEFLGTTEDIDVHSHGEFRGWRWMNIYDLYNNIVDFKKDLYKKVIRCFFDAS